MEKYHNNTNQNEESITQNDPHMAQLDREIAYYEKMLGVDSGDNNMNNLLKEELERDNMWELFSCVDAILSKPQEETQATQEDEAKLLGKREPKKGSKFAKPLKKQPETNKQKILKVKKFIEKTTKNNVVKKVQLLQRTVAGLPARDIAKAYYICLAMTEDYSKYKYAVFMALLEKLESPLEVISSLFLMILKQATKLKSDHLKTAKLCSGVLSLVHYLYISDIFPPSVLVGILNEVFIRNLTLEILSQNLTKKFIQLILKSVRKHDAGHFLEAVDIIKQRLEAFGEQEGLDRLQNKELGELRVFYEDKVEKLRSNLDIGPHSDESNSFVINFIKKSLKNTEFISLDQQFSDIKEKLLNQDPKWLEPIHDVEKQINLLTDPNNLGEDSDPSLLQNKQKMMKIAEKMGLETDIQRRVLVVILSSTDVTESIQKLISIKLKRLQKKEVVDVLLKACLHEKKYNKFYGAIAKKLCFLDKEFTAGAHYSIWDAVKTIDGFEKQKEVAKFARFVSDLLTSKALDNRLFKYLEAQSLSKRVIQFSKIVLKAFLVESETLFLRRFANRISAKPQNALVCSHLRDLCFLIEAKKEDYAKKIDGDVKKKERFFENIGVFVKAVKHRISGEDGFGFSDGDDDGEVIEF